MQVTDLEFLDATAGESYPSISVKRFTIGRLYYLTVVCENYGGNNGLVIFHVECKNETVRENIIEYARGLTSFKADIPATRPTPELLTFTRAISFDE